MGGNDAGLVWEDDCGACPLLSTESTLSIGQISVDKRYLYCSIPVESSPRIGWLDGNC